MLKTPDYVLIESIGTEPPPGAPAGASQPDYLPAGAFVRPIEERYLPKDWKDYVAGGRWVSKDEVVCYTRVGLRVIKKSNIRQV